MGRPAISRAAVVLKSDNELRPDNCYFPIPPPTALLYFVSAGLLMDTALAPLFMLEMLHDIRHEDVAPVKTAFLQGAIQEAARGSDRTAGTIFLVAWLLPCQHERRRRGLLTNNGLCRANIQRAALATRDGLGNLREFLRLRGPFSQILLHKFHPDLNSNVNAYP
jgi:hypothetical protein